VSDQKQQPNQQPYDRYSGITDPEIQKYLDAVREQMKKPEKKG
jgi:hypothetical protein